MMRNTEAITEESELPERQTREAVQDDSNGPVTPPADRSIGNGSVDQALKETVDGAAIPSDAVMQENALAKDAKDDESSVADGPIPGDVPPVPGLWRADEAESFRARWREVQLHFVDDPHLAAAEADELVSDAVSALTNSLAARCEDLAGWQSTGASTSTGLPDSTRSPGSSDTEALRVAVQRYRSFLDNLLDVERTDSRR